MMSMKKQNALIMTVLAGGVCIAASVAGSAGLLPLWAAAVLVIVFFPVFLVSLGLWWNASEKEGDTPFIGY
ncbi:MAG: energy-converting hydrogenase subunit [Methanofollis sp.]|nr:energy-converting hydrogenase subunit [Methanofollis sp.]